MLTRAEDGDEERGASLLEFVLVLPVFLTLVAGILVYGIAFFAQQAVRYAADRGAEAAVSIDPSADDFNNLAAQRAATRISAVLSAFPGVDAVQPFPLSRCSDDGESGEINSSTICVIADTSADGVRRVEIRLTLSFQNLFPGFVSQRGLIPSPAFISATGSAVVAAPSGGNAS